MTRTVRPLAAVMILIPSLVLSLGAAEIVVRVLRPEYRSIQTDRAMWAYDPLLGWHGIAHTEAIQGFDDDRRVSVKLNARGFRGEERPTERVTGKTRVILLGDSFAFGFGVALDERLSEVAEQLRDDLEFVNLGVTGYSTDQELLVFRQEGLRYAPDVVVLLFVSNDVSANASAVGHGHPKPLFRVEGSALELSNVPVPESSWPLRAKYALMRRSALFNLAWQQLRPLARKTGANRLLSDELLGGSLAAGSAVPCHEGPGGTPCQLAITTRLIEALRDEVEAAGARFLLVVAASDSHLRAASDVEAELLAWCIDHGVDCIDTYPLFRDHIEQHPEDRLFLQDQHHWTTLGHRLVAKRLVAALAELTPQPASP